MTEAASDGPFAVGDWVIDASANELRRGHETRSLEPLAMAVLADLLSQPGEVVAIDDLLDRHWQGRHAEPGMVTRCINQIRSALGDDARAPTYIETIRKRGYRFVAPVRDLGGASGPGEVGGSAWERRRRLPLAVLSAGFIVTAIIAAFALLRDWGDNAAPAAHEPPTLAIVAFDEIDAGVDTSLFANGVRADIVDELIRMGELVVISPMAVDQLVSPDTTALREAFTITHVLSGAVQSADGRIKVSVELIDARTNQSIWSARFDRELEAVFAIQDEIAIGVANQLAIKLSAELVDQIGTVPTTSLAAYRLVQRANASDDPRTKVAFLEEALALDANYAEAHSEIAIAIDQTETNAYEVHDRVVFHAEEALRLQPFNASAHFVLGNLLLNQNRTRDGFVEIERASSLAPNNNLYAYLLSVIHGLFGREQLAVPLREGIARRCGDAAPDPVRFWMAGDHDGFQSSMRARITKAKAARFDESACTADLGVEAPDGIAFRLFRLAGWYQSVDNYVGRLRHLYQARDLRRPRFASPVDAKITIANTFSAIGDYEAADRWFDHVERDGVDSIALFIRMRSLQERGDPAAMSTYLDRWEDRGGDAITASRSTLDSLVASQETESAKRHALMRKLWEGNSAVLDLSDPAVVANWLRELNYPIIAAVSLGWRNALFEPTNTENLARETIRFHDEGAISTADGYYVVGWRYQWLVYMHAMLGDVEAAIDAYEKAERWAWRRPLT